MLKLGEEQTLTTSDGREWRLDRLELRTIRAFRDYVRAQVGDPFATVDRYVGKVADVHLMPLLKEAEDVKRQLASFSMGCPLAERHLRTEEGLAKLTALLLKKSHPQASEDDAFAVAIVLADELAARLETAQGAVPNGGAPGEASPGEPTGGKSTDG